MFFICVVCLLFVYLNFNWPRERESEGGGRERERERETCFSITSCIPVQYCSCRPTVVCKKKKKKQNISKNKRCIHLTSFITLHATVILSDKKIDCGVLFFLMVMRFTSTIQKYEQVPHVKTARLVRIYVKQSSNLASAKSCIIVLMQEKKGNGI